MAHLTLVLDNREVRKFVLNKGVTTIGRAQENDIVINNLALSRRHAQIELRGGRYEVVDLQSQNGVYVNGDRVRTTKVLSDKDALTLGTYQFMFRVAESDPEPEINLGPRERVPDRPPQPQTTEPELSLEESEDGRGPLLVLKYNDVELQRATVEKDRFLIGRTRDCDLQVPERRLSRRHCEICVERGRHVVRDLGSQNGTYVNRRRIRGDQELTHGDVLNFAEYSVLFLTDRGAYSGPDSHAADSVPPDDGALANSPTIMPPSYRQTGEGSDEPIRPSEFEDPDGGSAPLPPVAMTPRSREELHDPLTRSPAEARARREDKDQIRVIRERPSPPAPPRGEEAAPPRKAKPLPVASRKTEPPAPRRSEAAPAAKERASVPPAAVRSTEPPPVAKPKSAAAEIRGRPAEALRDELPDVPDEEPAHEKDQGLEAWYQSRREKSWSDEVEEAEDREEDSVLLPRPPSSVSQVLSTMMVDRRELDRNLRGPGGARLRRFYVEARHGDRVLYSGPLTQPVTILGTDREADIKLKGRYVAGRHSLLVRVRDSLLLVRLGSTSAARVNGLPKLQAFLKSGDVVQIDETTIKITEE